jgi:hypothetical protein
MQVFFYFLKYTSPPQHLLQTLKSYTPAFQLKIPGPYHSKTLITTKPTI